METARLNDLMDEWRRWRKARNWIFFCETDSGSEMVSRLRNCEMTVCAERSFCSEKIQMIRSGSAYTDVQRTYLLTCWSNFPSRCCAFAPTSTRAALEIDKLVIEASTFPGCRSAHANPCVVANEIKTCASENIYHRFARPVELAVVDVALALEEILKDFPQIVVVGRFEEVQSPHIAQIRCKLFGMILT